MFVSVAVTFPEKRELPADYRFVRVLHEAELPAAKRTTPFKMPEVRPLFPNHFSEFGEGWQKVSWSLNPLLTAGNMTAVYNDHLWIANGHGFGNTPRQNYFVPEDLDADKTIAVESLTCGGNLLRVIGEDLVKTNAGKVPCYLIETLDHRYPLFSITDRPWLITEATKLDPNGNPTRFPQGRQENGYQPGVRHPLVTNHSFVAAIEKWRVVEWTESYAPDPYKVYP